MVFGGISLLRAGECKHIEPSPMPWVHETLLFVHHAHWLAWAETLLPGLAAPGGVDRPVLVDQSG